MTKKYLLQLTMLLALVMTTACNKENIADETTTPVTIKINLAELESGYNTRASYVHPELEGMRVTMIVAQNGVKLHHETKTNQSLTGDSSISFETNLVTGKSYDISVWADFGESYYTLNNLEEANPDQTPYVSMETTRTGSDNKNDAYWGISENVTIKENKPIGITLKRPLAIVNIKATDYSSVTEKPTKYSTTINAYTGMNLLTGELIEDMKGDITINGTIGEASDGSLSYDYFFAKEQTENLSDFIVKYSSVDGNSTYSYTFTGIPVKRNNLTNVSGNIFTNSQTDQQ